MRYTSEIPPVDALFKLYQTTGWNAEYNLSPLEFHKAVCGSYCTLSGWSGDILVGFGRVVSDGLLHGMIYEMIVHPDFQKCGVGSRILKGLLDKCKSDSIREIQLFCAEGKERFYLKHGFVRRSETAPGMSMSLTTQVDCPSSVENRIL